MSSVVSNVYELPVLLNVFGNAVEAFFTLYILPLFSSIMWTSLIVVEYPAYSSQNVTENV